MPVYNEARTLRTIVGRVLCAPIGLPIELVVVDDGSSDDSAALLEELGRSDHRIRVIRHPVNRGKGAAIRTAITHMSGDVAVVQDSDLEYDPRDYPRLLQPIIDGRADAVYGSRFAASPERRVLLFWHSLGNKLLTLMTNVLNNINLTDMETGYKAVRAELLKSMVLRSERFGIEPEITTRLVQAGARIYEVPISYYGRSYAEGKSIGWRDGIQAVWLLFKFRWFQTDFLVRRSSCTLESMTSARGFNRWMFSRFRPWIGDRVLDAGCGIGSLTELMLDRRQLVAIDADPAYVQRLSTRFGHLENLAVRQVDLADQQALAALADYRFDTVVSSNVLEHIERDQQVAASLAGLLEPGGRMVVLVPGMPSLFSDLDRELGHYRRYRPQDLRALLENAGLEVSHEEQFNRFGLLGWFFNKATGRTSVAPWQMRIYSLFLPLAKLMDALQLGPGLSLIAVGIRRSSQLPTEASTPPLRVTTAG